MNGLFVCVPLPSSRMQRLYNTYVRTSGGGRLDDSCTLVNSHAHTHTKTKHMHISLPCLPSSRMRTRVGVHVTTYVPAAAHVSMTILVKSWEARPFCRITCSRFWVCV
jgi:uncharacterized protein (UPF0548 family)